MARRTVQQILGAVQRKTGASVSEIYEALTRVHRQIYAKFPWPWTLREGLLQLNASYSVGTVSILDGTSSLVGLGTTWDTSWLYKRVSFGSNTDYKVASFGTATTATLAQTINTGSDWSDAGYTIYQDTYALPTDCEPGGIICITNPMMRYRMRKIPPAKLEERSSSRGMTFNNIQSDWCDQGFDETTGAYLIRVDPPPSGTYEYKILYRCRVPDLSDMTTRSEIPETFDYALELLAEAELKRVKGDPTWIVAKQEGYQVIQSMRRTITTSLDDVYQMNSWPTIGDVSMMDMASGLMLAGPTGAP